MFIGPEVWIIQRCVGAQCLNAHSAPPERLGLSRGEFYEYLVPTGPSDGGAVSVPKTH